MRSKISTLFLILAIFAGIASANDVRESVIESTKSDPKNVDRHGRVHCKVADSGACWGFDHTDKPFYKKKSFWISEGIIIGGLVADNWSTERALHSGFGYEANPIIGKHPSNFKLRGITIIGIGVQTSLNVAMYELYSRQESSKGWRYSAEWGVAGVQSAFSVPIVIHNLHIYNDACKGTTLRCN